MKPPELIDANDLCEGQIVSLIGADQRLDAVQRQLVRGQDVLTMRNAGGPMHHHYDDWLKEVAATFEGLPDRFSQRRMLLVQWMGLPSPAFQTEDHSTATYDQHEFNRVMNVRLAWLAEKLQELIGTRIEWGATEAGAPPESINVTPRTGTPKLFIGSSVEGLDLARALHTHLEHDLEPLLWKDGPFGMGDGNLEAVVRALDQFDFAALILTPDDTIQCRSDPPKRAPRDNVVLELGLFMGRLGRRRTFAVYDKSLKDLKLPSDLAGVTEAEYYSAARSDNNPMPMLNTPAMKIINAAKELGRFSIAEIASGAAF